MQETCAGTILGARDGKWLPAATAHRGTRMAHWEHFGHAADIGIRGVGATPAQAFEQAALAAIAVITEPGWVRGVRAVQIELNSTDLELLLADWINAVIYQIATRRMLFGRFEVQLEGDQLHATAWGEPIDLPRHRPSVEIKGATYTELKVYETDAGEWVAQCVVDV